MTRILTFFRSHPIILALAVLVAYIHLFGWMALLHVTVFVGIVVCWLFVVLGEDDDFDDIDWLGGPRTV